MKSFHCSILYNEVTIPIIIVLKKEFQILLYKIPKFFAEERVTGMHFTKLPEDCFLD